MEFLICLGIAILIDLGIALLYVIYEKLSDWEYFEYIVPAIVEIIITTTLVWVVREVIRNEPQIQQNEEQRIEEIIEE